MKTIIHKCQGLIVCLAIITCNANAQPYLDIASLQYIGSPDHGLLNREKTSASLQTVSAQATVPFPLRNKKDLIIVSPFFDCWSPKIKPSNRDYTNQYSIGLPVSLLKFFADSNWSLLITGIVRKNGHDFSEDDNWQVGTAIITNCKAASNLTYKAGIYVNREFFGVFIMPLLGIDWQVNEKTNLFGVLPGNLTLEHELGRQLYTGITFKAITSSFKTKSGFWRLDENRVGVFLDYYILKNVVLTAETGHSVLRKIRTSVTGRNYSNWNVNDNMYFKLSLAYRLRLR